MLTGAFTLMLLEMMSYLGAKGSSEVNIRL